jgi:hypothetical protein
MRPEATDSQSLDHKLVRSRGWRKLHVRTGDAKPVARNLKMSGYGLGVTGFVTVGWRVGPSYRSGRMASPARTVPDESTRTCMPRRRSSRPTGLLAHRSESAPNLPANFAHPV